MQIEKKGSNILSKHTGGCHCGEIKLETDLDPMLVSMCNCGRCRTLFGALALGAMYADEEVSVVGETKAYEFIGGSGMQVVIISALTAGVVFIQWQNHFLAWRLLLLAYLIMRHLLSPREKFLQIINSHG